MSGKQIQVSATLPYLTTANLACEDHACDICSLCVTDIAPPLQPPFLANRTLNLIFALVEGAKPLSLGTENSSPGSRGQIMIGLNQRGLNTVSLQDTVFPILPCC